MQHYAQIEGFLLPGQCLIPGGWKGEKRNRTCLVLHLLGYLAGEDRPNRAGALQIPAIVIVNNLPARYHSWGQMVFSCPMGQVSQSLQAFSQPQDVRACVVRSLSHAQPTVWIWFLIVESPSPDRRNPL